MKSFVLLIGLLSSAVLKAQTGYSILYETQPAPAKLHVNGMPVNPPVIRNRLIFNDSISLSYFLADQIDKVRPGKIYGASLKPHAVIYNKNSNTLLIGTQDKNVLFNDTIKIRQWVLQEDFYRQILGHQCQSAYTVSANNDTTLVWFTTDIPYPFGPVYCIGFPGLVLEEYEQDTGRYWKAVSIDSGEYRVVMPANKRILTCKDLKKN